MKFLHISSAVTSYNLSPVLPRRWLGAFFCISCSFRQPYVLDDSLTPLTKKTQDYCSYPPTLRKRHKKSPLIHATVTVTEQECQHKISIYVIVHTRCDPSLLRLLSVLRHPHSGAFVQRWRTIRICMTIDHEWGENKKKLARKSVAERWKL